MVARRILLSGHACIDPALLGLDPGTANSVSIPIGREPGRAYLTVTRSAGDALSLNAAQTISFVDNGVTTVLSGFYVDRRSVINVDGDLKAACLVELFDKRALLSLSGINKRFNCLKPLPYHLSDSTQRLEKYFPDSLAGGTALNTWAQVWSALWAELPAGIAGAAPSLPYTPAGTPKNFEFRGSTWDLAIPEFLAAICCTTKYDPITETFSVVRLSQAQTGLAAALATANASTTQPLLFHSRDPSGLTVTDAPASWFILAPKQHVQNDDHTEPALDGTTASGVSGAASGTKEAIWLNTPATYCAIGGIQNNAEIVARAADLATELSGKANNSNGDGHIEYSGCVAALVALGTGSQVSEIVVSDYGGTGEDAEGMRTKLYQYTLDLPHGPPQDINTDKIIRVRLDAVLSRGGSALATVVVYVEGTGEWEPDQCTLTIYDSLDFAANLPIGLEVWSKWNYDSEKWELLSVPPGTEIVFFELYQDKEIPKDPGENWFLAKVLEHNGTIWVATATTIKVWDYYWFNFAKDKYGFHTGVIDLDRGWARFRSAGAGADPDNYDLIWMSGPAHTVYFTLDENRFGEREPKSYNATVAALDHFPYGNDGLTAGQTFQVYFREEAYPWAIEGCHGRAIYNDRERRYEVFECEQIAMYGQAVLGSDMCSFGNVDVTDFSADSPYAFNFLPKGVAGFDGSGTAGSVQNARGHKGFAGDIVFIVFIAEEEQYSIVDVQLQTMEVVVDVYWDPEAGCWMKRKREVALESCKLPEQPESIVCGDPCP